MNVIRAVYEKGIEVRLNDNRWELSNTTADSNILFDLLSDVSTEMSPLRPVLVTEKREFGDDLTLLIRSTAGPCYAACVSELMNRANLGSTFFPVYHLMYLLGAANYHCQSLAELYVSIAAKYASIQQRLGNVNKSDIGMFSYQTEPYHEFEAIISSVRRLYDSTRYLLWPRFGKTNGGMPNSFQKLLNSQIFMPHDLFERLQDSWAESGKKLKDYRDCIHHYVPVDFGMASAYMQRHSSGAWTTMIRIPDNPEARSKNQFTFEHNYDALTYAWGLVDEALDIATVVVKACCPEDADA